MIKVIKIFEIRIFLQMVTRNRHKITISSRVMLFHTVLKYIRLKSKFIKNDNC